MQAHAAEVIALLPADVDEYTALAEIMPTLEAELFDQLHSLGFTPYGPPTKRLVPVYPAGRAWLVRWTGTREAS